MTKLERDHPRLTASRENDGHPPRLEQFQCGMCGSWFLMRSSLDRHKVAELPGFIAELHAKRLVYEASRRRHRVVFPVIDKATLKALEEEAERQLRLVE